MQNREGMIFNIQRFSVHDGPGIRTTVFMKGCNLRCKWCHNPESYTCKSQIRYEANECVSCGRCNAVCPCGVITMNKKRNNVSQCKTCKSCVEACVHGALKCIGEEKSIDKIMEIVVKDKKYYDNSGGGITISGGEPLLQADFVTELCRCAKALGIHTALDTAGNVDFKLFEQVLPYVDLILLDLKIMDSKCHQYYTGVTNELILENARKIFEYGVNVNIRVPVIKGINDSLRNMEAVHAFIKGQDCVTDVKLLPYHSMGIVKAAGISMEMEVFEAPDENVIKEMERVLII